MKTIIVPTDFSAAAYNAARYALGLAGQMGATRVVLYHAYELVVPVPDMPSAIPMVDSGELKLASQEGLEKMRNELATDVPANVVLDLKAENHLLAANIDGFCQEQQADLIVMGTEGGSHFEEILIGSNSVDVAKHTACPVIIVPADAVYHPIRKIVFACDFKHIGENTPIGPLKSLLRLFNAALHVLNIDHSGKGLAGETPMESLLLDTLLEGYHPIYHFVDNENVADGIMEFSEKEGVDLIFIIPRKHGLFEGMFRRSRTTQLAFRSHIPLLTIHE
ncbi:universal stress protein [Chitinophaga sancti]|uniref:Universal stress protein n=1 Tax=Chitinophaga sancti TaxID=1004 RepID=A0A1K1NW98_9BACT|nr:universal stress protein [Chitinophaga sancti]WQD60239.1 universal stress protein [Chitinophaga sancti]WQG87633.1 universal stress protein [Chitinophaga sancti]SFW39575.1 Nucleotide-binding universal stress protein, UspA family [Chitinophaga sancti]